MAWEDFSIDKIAHDLVFKFHEEEKEVVNQAHKMRTTVAYGLERFWGEHLRLDGKKSEYWEATWQQLTEMMARADITVPNCPQDLWDSSKFSLEYRKVTLAILTQLCDSMVWWTQRFKPAANKDFGDV